MEIDRESPEFNSDHGSGAAKYANGHLVDRGNCGRYCQRQRPVVA